MNKKLAPLLSNHPVEEHAAIIQQNAHIIFGTGHAARKQGKFKYDRAELMAALKLIPLKKRRTVRKAAGQLSIPSSTLQHILRPANAEHHDVGVAVRHKSKLKPTLTEMNKLSRFNFALEQVNTTAGPPTRAAANSRVKYFAQFDKVHVDEKWFYLCRDGENYILAGDEPPPKRHVKHKNFIGKVMFLCAQARPRWDPATNSMWDGKLGIWPIGKYTVAQRTSANRPAGTTEWENETIDNDAYRHLLVNKVFTAIMDKWPAGQFADPNFKIKIQQDGAGGHCCHTDDYISEALELLGLTDKISLYTQPANSPDLNICDLGLFNAMQQAYWDESPKNAVEIIECVERTYRNYDPKKINFIFLTLLSIYNEVIEGHGDNHYIIPHMGKERLEREGNLPVTVEVSEVALGFVEGL